MALTLTKAMVVVLLISLVGIIAFSTFKEGNKEYSRTYDEGYEETIDFFGTNNTGAENLTSDFQDAVRALDEDEGALVAGFYLIRGTLKTMMLPFKSYHIITHMIGTFADIIPVSPVVIGIILSIILLVFAMAIFKSITNRPGVY